MHYMYFDKHIFCKIGFLDYTKKRLQNIKMYVKNTEIRIYLLSSINQVPIIVVWL